jgi:hypothetical protein
LENRGQALTLMTVRNHLFATEHVVVRGLVSPLASRLGDHLRSCRRHFVTVTNAEIRNVLTDHVSEADVVRVGLASIVWAHEFVALTGDDFRRRHKESEPEHPVIMTMNRPEGLVISGWQTEAAASQDPSFLVVKRPRCEGTTALAARHAELLSSLPYVLVHHAAPAVVVQGSLSVE